MIPRSTFVIILISALTLTAAAQTTFTTITDFGEGDGQYPNTLAQGLDGNLYGTVLRPHRADSAGGFVFYLTTSGSYTDLPGYSCTTNDCGGYNPEAGVTLAGDGNFYGTTSGGGEGQYRTTNKSGTIYRANSQTGLTTLYSFCSKLGCQDGDDLYTPLTLGSDGNLYGFTQYGGLHKSGTAFVMTLAGKFNTIHQFCAEKNCADGGIPYSLIQATDGNFYGFASGGTGAYCPVTANSCGIVFKMTPQGVTTTLYNFCSLPNCTDGYNALSLIQASDGNLYGATAWTGTTGPGTIFKLSLQGQLTTLYTLCDSTCAVGRTYAGDMIQASDGNFYGISSGETCECSMVFEFTSSSVYSTLYTFCTTQYCATGSSPTGIMQATDGNFYGTTHWGGPSGYGTAFQFSTGLTPFIQTVTSNGAPESSVIILGSNLTGATSVTFSGTPATFTIVSSTEITATIPKNATTGPIEVTTPSALLTSNKTFIVTN
jgi:uncharacterized repeat protein (TIGR03803 family)